MSAPAAMHLDCGYLDDQCNTGVCDEDDDQCGARSGPHEGNACDDGLFCNENETCPVRCLHRPATLSIAATSMTRCNTGVCDEDDDQCEADPVPHEGNACDDGLFCNENETCQSGVCTGGNALDCGYLDDQCNTGVCDEDDDQCEADPAPHEGNACDDGLFCNENEDLSVRCLHRRQCSRLRLPR